MQAPDLVRTGGTPTTVHSPTTRSPLCYVVLNQGNQRCSVATRDTEHFCGSSHGMIAGLHLAGAPGSQVPTDPRTCGTGSLSLDRSD